MSDAQDFLWMEADPLQRLGRALQTGYMADLTVTVKNGEKFQCHSFILSLASAKFANMLREKTEIQLPEVDAFHFLLLLEIIYTGKTLPANKETMISVGRVAHELQVHTAEVYCAKQLCSLVEVFNVCRLLSFAHLIEDEDLEEECLKVVRKNASVIIQTPDFINCDLDVVEKIVQQDELSNVDELQIFQACAHWVAKHPDTKPREAMRPVIRHIRFLAIPAASFAEHVMFSQLLTAEEERNVLCCIVRGVDELMPEGFSRKKLRGNMEIEVDLGVDKCLNIYPGAQEISARPIRFTTNKDGYKIVGVELYLRRQDKSTGTAYRESIEVILRNEEKEVLASIECKDYEVNCSDIIRCTFKTPCVISANVTYILHVNFTSTPHVKRSCFLYCKKSLKFDNSSSLDIIQDAVSPIESIIFTATDGN